MSEPDPDRNPDEPDPHPEPTVSVEIYFPEKFYQEAAKRGVPADLMASRLGHLFMQGIDAGHQLFEDWESRNAKDQSRWARDYAREHLRLEFPYLDDEEQG